MTGGSKGTKLAAARASRKRRAILFNAVEH